MWKPISPLVHGILDYLVAGTYVALPRVMGWDQRVTGVMTAGGAFLVGYSLLTRYPLGLIRLLPLQAHLAIDGLLDAGVLGTSLRLRDEDAAVRGTMAGLALAGAVAVLLTRTEPAVEAWPRVAR